MTANVEKGVPLVVHVGFAGSRTLSDELSDADESAFVAQVGEALAQRLTRLRGDLGLGAGHVLCGVSSLAAGSDLLFAAACDDAKILRRVLLPRELENFLADSEDGVPDFTPDERAEARRRAERSPTTCVIQVSEVSDAPTRVERFEDVNLEIARMSDVLVCMERAGADGNRGGTRQLMELAAARGKPVLHLTVHRESDGRPRLVERWLGVDGPVSSIDFVPPRLPQEFDELDIAHGADGDLPPMEQYLAELKRYSERQAEETQGAFAFAAWTIIVTHGLATLCASVALIMADGAPLLSKWLLGIEILLLSGGFVSHRRLHKAHKVKRWALMRLTAETAWSCGEARFDVPLRYLFRLPFPRVLRPLLRTLHVLHLRDVRGLDVDADDWRERRCTYASRRLRGQRGQIDYFEKERLKARRFLRGASAVFFLGSLIALVCAAVKLGVKLTDFGPDALKDWLGVAAIWLPVVAAGAHALAASLDKEAREHTYSDQREFALRQLALIEGARSKRECETLVLESEERLLGETVGWFARRSFTGPP